MGRGSRVTTGSTSAEWPRGEAWLLLLLRALPQTLPVAAAAAAAMVQQAFLLLRPHFVVVWQI